MDAVHPGDDGRRRPRLYRLNPFDLTKVWPKADYPLIEVGVMELNRNPENLFAEVEQAAFSPANIVPGIGFSPDKMLQGRLFSYGDAQRYRLGVNFNHIPVNAPKCPFHSYHRDGAMRTDGNLGGTPTYWPNSQGQWEDQPRPQRAAAADRGRRRALGSSRGRRPLSAAGRSVPEDDAAQKRRCSTIPRAPSVARRSTSRSGTSPTAPRPIRPTAKASRTRSPRWRPASSSPQPKRRDRLA